MRLESPTRSIDSDGNPIEEIEVLRSRFDRIAIKRTDGGVEVRAHDESVDAVVEFEAALTDERYKGVSIVGPQRRRDVDDDLQDALHAVGYALVDTDVRNFDGNVSTENDE